MASGGGRRALGVLLLAMSLLAVVVVPAATGHAIAGVPHAVPVPGPPVVGQCVGQAFNPAWDVLGGDASTYKYPELTVGDCSRAHYGEVVAIIAHPVKPKIDMNPGGGYSIDDKNMSACYAAAGRFVQGDAAADGSRSLFGYWALGLFTPTVALTPTTRQRAAGQQWLACATYLSDLSDLGEPLVLGYDGSLRSAQSTGVGRDHSGYCPTEADWNEMTSTSCLRPHHGEIFGFGVLADATARTTLTSSCAKMVSQVTKSADLARDGRLIISVQATDDTGTELRGASIPRGSSLQCGVLTTGGRLLRGSLIAIGSEPVPWT